jgi:hypothetical protein
MEGVLYYSFKGRPIMPERKPELVTLTTLGMEINFAIACGHMASFDDIYSKLEEGNLFEWLGNRFSGQFQFGISPGPWECRAAGMVLGEMARVKIDPPEDREITKLNAEISGLHLLLELILLSIKQKEWIISSNVTQSLFAVEEESAGH